MVAGIKEEAPVSPKHWACHGTGAQKRRVHSLSTPRPALDLNHQDLEFSLPNLVHPLTHRGAGSYRSRLPFGDSQVARPSVGVSESPGSVESGPSLQSQAH